MPSHPVSRREVAPTAFADVAGWLAAHLRFLLLLCPRWLFFYPGIAILLFGFGTGALLLPGPVALSSNITLDVHSLIVACLAILVGSQCLSFWIIARLYTAARGLLPGRPHLEFFKKRVTLERALVFGSSVATTGIGGVLVLYRVGRGRFWSAGIWVDPPGPNHIVHTCRPRSADRVLLHFCRPSSDAS